MNTPFIALAELVVVAGVEPATLPLKRARATIELHDINITVHVLYCANPI